MFRTNHADLSKYSPDYYDENHFKVDILLAANCYYQVVTNSVRRGPSGGPVAVYSRLEWLLAGPEVYRENIHTNISSIYTLKCSECDVFDTNEPESLSEALKKFWDLECVGTKKSGKLGCRFVYRYHKIRRHGERV